MRWGILAERGSKFARFQGLPSVLGIWVVLALALSQLTGRVVDWFDMTDELRYERLAASIARSHSLVPRIHGTLVESWAQLYPVLIAPAFQHANAPADVHAAHLINAWVMSSACIPAYLLARRVLGPRWPAYLVAVLTVAMPWILYSSMLMTEVAAYPAFLWAAFLMQRSIATPSRTNDLLALCGMALAFFGRTAMLTLVIVLPVAILVFEWRRGRAREAIRSHDLLAGAYAVLAVVAIVLEATGKFSRVYGIYAHYTGRANLASTAYFGSLFEHLATFSLALGILPCLLAGAWLFVRVVRPPASTDAHAFACLGALLVLVIPAQVTNFDDVYNLSFVHDRFLIYLVPVVLIAALYAVSETDRLRWSLLPGAAVLVVGYATGAIPAFTWQQFKTITPDTPASSLYRPLVALTGGLTVTRSLLAAATCVLVTVAIVLPRRALRPLTIAYIVVCLPLLTWFMFDRFFGEQGWSGRPVTAQVHGTLDWIDAAVGPNAAVSIVPYPISSDWFVSQRYWRDVEFWNRAVVRDVHYPETDVFEYTGFWFPKLYPHFDPTTGVADRSPTRYVVQTDSETRFRISGPVVATSEPALVVDTGGTWRLDWLSRGLYDDGWTKPHVTAHVRIYPLPGQRGAVIRSIDVGLRAPDGVAQRRVDLLSNREAWHGDATQGNSLHEQIRVCVPPHRSAEVTISTPDASTIPGDQRSLSASGSSRQGGVFISGIGLSDDLHGACTVSAGV